MALVHSIIAVAAFVAAPDPAGAVDWWLVAGGPGSDTVTFVDSDSIRRDGDEVAFALARVTRDDFAARDGAERLRCGADAGSAEREALRRFVCASPGERLSLAAMLGGMTPYEAARALFDAPAR